MISCTLDAFPPKVSGLIRVGVPRDISPMSWLAACWQEEGAVTCAMSSLSPQQSAHRAGLRSFIRYGWRWSWRVAAFTMIFNMVSTGLSAYRNKTTISNFAAAGGKSAVTLYASGWKQGS
uniref:Complex I assembly factor TIMMDC1, mitochondrial n=1 Tax=Cyanistes caeruleus TaxID=156563 RepID=A0A8C0Z8R7_CYACU